MAFHINIWEKNMCLQWYLWQKSYLRGVCSSEEIHFRQYGKFLLKWASWLKSLLTQNLKRFKVKFGKQLSYYLFLTPFKFVAGGGANNLPYLPIAMPRTRIRGSHQDNCPHALWLLPNWYTLISKHSLDYSGLPCPCAPTLKWVP